MYKWRTGRSCVFKNTVHLVFITKYRRDVFTEEMLARMKELMNETCEQMEAELIEFGGEDDHVHLLVIVPPKIAVSILVGKLKGKSAYYLRKEFWPQLKDKLWGNHLWSPSYCVVSCGGAPLDIVKEYVKNQRTPPSQKQIDQALKIAKVAGLA
jgi:putative transposase